MTPADIRALKNLIVFCRAQKIQSFKWRDFEAEFTLEAVTDQPENQRLALPRDDCPSDEERTQYRMRS